MKCVNCNGEENYVDDVLGETVCNDCGYVMVSTIFESSISVKSLEGSSMWKAIGGERRNHLSRTADRGTLGSVMETNGYTSSYIKRLNKTQKMFKGRQDQSLTRGYLEINMILSPYLPNASLKERAHHYYKKLFFDRAMIGFTIETRACSLALIVLRENGIPITIAELARSNNMNPSRVSKCARKMARELKNPYILHSMPISPWVDRVTYDMIMNKYGNEELKREFKRDAKRVVEYLHDYVVDRDISFTKSYMASALWITVLLRTFGNHPEFTQHEIGNACNCTPVSLRNRNKETFKMLSINKDVLAKLTVKQFIAGVRYE